jgi:hypothetical protein
MPIDSPGGFCRHPIAGHGRPSADSSGRIRKAHAKQRRTPEGVICNAPYARVLRENYTTKSVYYIDFRKHLFWHCLVPVTPIGSRKKSSH